MDLHTLRSVRMDVDDRLALDFHVPLRIYHGPRRARETVSVLPSARDSPCPATHNGSGSDSAARRGPDPGTGVLIECFRLQRLPHQPVTDIPETSATPPQRLLLHRRHLLHSPPIPNPSTETNLTGGGGASGGDPVSVSLTSSFAAAAGLVIGNPAVSAALRRYL